MLEVTPHETKTPLKEDQAHSFNHLSLESDEANDLIIEGIELTNENVCNDRNEGKDDLNNLKESLDVHEIKESEKIQSDILVENDNVNNFPICDENIQIGGVSEASNLEYEPVNNEDEQKEGDMTEGEANCNEIQTVIKTENSFKESNGFEEDVEET